MPEFASTSPKPSQSGIRGWAMMLPVVGLPVGLHALGGALFVGAGIVVAAAPIAVPAAVPLLYNAASKGGFDSIAKKIFPSDRTAGTLQKVAINVPDATVKDTEPVISTAVQADV